MNAVEFTYWLKGFLHEGKYLNSVSVEAIQLKLEEVAPDPITFEPVPTNFAPRYKPSFFVDGTSISGKWT